MDALVFGLKCVSWRDAMDMTLSDISIACARASGWLDAGRREAERAARKRRR